MINVTKSFLPPIEEYNKHLKTVWESGWLTNNGILLQELERNLKEYLAVKHLFFCTNGTIAIQIAIKALDLRDCEVITTPFSYVATTNSIIWEGCEPVFVDINNTDFNIDPDKIEKAITPRTKAILATHVYGNPCDVDKIDKIAKKHNLKVVYDAAHAFGSLINGKQILSYGDVSTCSFHATKLFHTVEGGCMIANDPDVAQKIYWARQFGHVNDDYFSLGINGKNSEFHAAMGLCMLPRVKDLIVLRKKITDWYKNRLKDNPGVYIPESKLPDTEYNYSYFPVVFDSEEKLLAIKQALLDIQINTRRYFYPSLNTLHFLKKTQACPISEDISKRVLALPMSHEISEEIVEKVCKVITQKTA